MMNATQRLQQLRQRMAMAPFNLQAYMIPSCDAHQSEYIAKCDARRAFISGFTGSAGYAVVTTNAAALWTDGRYYLQASKQLDPALWTLMKQGLPETPEKEDWLAQTLPAHSRIGVDPLLTTVDQAQTLRQALEPKGHSLVSITSENLVDSVWLDRPSRPANPVWHLEEGYTGESAGSKLARLRRFLFEAYKPHKSGGKLKPTAPAGFLVNALDEVAWLLNLRGSDIAFNPVFFAYALVLRDECRVYVQPGVLAAEAQGVLEADGIRVREYQAVFEDLKELSMLLELGRDVEGKTVRLIAGKTCNLAAQEALGNPDFLETIPSPVAEFKSIKNEVELEGFRQCHLRDAAALCNYFGWLEQELIVKGRRDLSEVQAADQAEAFRSQQKDYVALSFDTISSVGPNAAIIHYKPEPATCANLTPAQIYLCDSGAQYKDGTTDVTRTLHLGTPTPQEKQAFTRVLQGHIALDRAVFPAGTTGFQLDVLARLPLWQVGLDYRHGTGHGVGAFLNVHEGPHGISFRLSSHDYELKAGMTVTNEPGYYEDNHFGIRIENIMLIKNAATPHRFGDKQYFCFEHVTLVPLGLNLLDTSLLSPEEIEWVNAYHAECRAKISPLVNAVGLKWLEKETVGV